MTDNTTVYAEAIVAMARAERALDTVADELLSLARSIDGNNDLREKLVDIHLPLGNRLAFVESTALQAAHPATRTALATIITAGLVSRIGEIAQAVAGIAATARNHELAEIRVAQPLDDARLDALRQALERAVGKSLDVKVVVDPSVLGGVHARIGDQVIDGSLARRLADVRSRLGS